MDLPNSAMWTLDGVVEPKVTPTRGVAGSAPYNFLHFLAVHHGARTCGRKKKESRINSGVYQVTRGIISSYFQYLDRAVRENSVVVEYLLKEWGSSPVYNSGRSG